MPDRHGGSKGTKIFSLVGKVNNTGLVEVPMGITLREIVYDIGGGVPGGKKLKAVQTGGPSGGCIPESLIDLPVDFDRLTEVGSMMGSGGMIVMDEIDLYGRCGQILHELFEGRVLRKVHLLPGGDETHARDPDRNLRGQGNDRTDRPPGGAGMGDDRGLPVSVGGTAANPVLSTLRYFKHEYEEHILNKRCSAKVCRGLLKYRILSETCKMCGACAKVCSADAITGKKKSKKVEGIPYKIDADKCIKCGMCFESCKFEAVEVQ